MYLFLCSNQSLKKKKKILYQLPEMTDKQQILIFNQLEPTSDFDSARNKPDIIIWISK